MSAPRITSVDLHLDDSDRELLGRAFDCRAPIEPLVACLFQVVLDELDQDNRRAHILREAVADRMRLRREQLREQMSGGGE